jgi:hypothetical protein
MKRFTLLAGSELLRAACMPIINDRGPDAPQDLPGNMVGGRFENEVFHGDTMASRAVWRTGYQTPAHDYPPKAGFPRANLSSADWIIFASSLPGGTFVSNVLQ